MEHVHEIRLHMVGNDKPIIVWSNEGVKELFIEYLGIDFSYKMKDMSSFEFDVHIANVNDCFLAIKILHLLQSHLDD